MIKKHQTKLDIYVHDSAYVGDLKNIGAGTKIWHFCHIMTGAKIGKECIIGQNCFIGSRAILGNRVKLQNNVSVYDLVTLVDHVFVGPSVVFTNDPNPRAKYPKSIYPQYGRWLPTKVHEGASIGANATIICGNVIGRWSMIGAGSVVTKNVPDYALVIGVPAKLVGWVCECGNKLNFKKGLARCSVCKKEYKLKNNQVKNIND